MRFNVFDLHITSHKHLFKRSSDFMVGDPDPRSPLTVNFGGFRTCQRGDRMFSICHVISKYHDF